MAHEAVPCHFAREIDARQVPRRKESCVHYCRRLRQTSHTDNGEG